METTNHFVMGKGGDNTSAARSCIMIFTKS